MTTISATCIVSGNTPSPTMITTSLTVNSFTTTTHPSIFQSPLSPMDLSPEIISTVLLTILLRQHRRSQAHHHYYTFCGFIIILKRSSFPVIRTVANLPGSIQSHRASRPKPPLNISHNLRPPSTTTASVVPKTMRRASTLAGASTCLSRAILTTSEHHHQYNNLFNAASAYATNAGSSRRWFSTSMRSISSGGSSTKFLLSMGCLAASVAAGASLLAEKEAFAKEPVNLDLIPKEVVLYQYEACPFCNKVKAFLDYYDVPYKVVEVNPLSKKEIKWSDYKKVPILMVDGEPLQDSSAIIDQMKNKLCPTKSNSIVDDEEEKKWRRWVDEHLVHVLSPNIYRNTSEALESFDYITSNGNFGFTEKYTVKYAGAAAMYFVSKKLKKKYNITDERASLYEAAETWVDALDGRDFLGGSKPNLADLAVFGVLRPIRYLRSGKDMVQNTRIGEWYTRMENVVGESSRIKA